jgi:cytochrome P450 family 9
VLRNPELIKQVTVKEFNSFVNHRFVFDENADKLFGRALFSLKDQKWRDMRNTLSPAFTGSKMRLMLTLMAESTETFIEHLVKKAEKEGDLEVEIKSLYEK